METSSKEYYRAQAIQQIHALGFKKYDWMKFSWDAGGFSGETEIVYEFGRYIGYSEGMLQIIAPSGFGREVNLALVRTIEKPSW